MTSLNFLLTRALARELQAGDEVLVTKLDHDGNVAPWLALQEDLGIVVRRIDVNDDLSLDYDSLASQLNDRTRVVAFTVAANSVGTAPDVRRIVELAHGAGALAWADAVHFGPARADRRRRLGRRRPPLLAVQVLRAAHGDGLREGGPARVVAPVQGAPGREPSRRAPLRARHLPARAARRLRRRGRLHRLDRLGRDGRARARARAAVPRRPARGRRPLTACRRWRVACRRSASTCPAARRRRSQRTWPTSTRSRSGGATTTRSRRCGSSGSTTWMGAVRAGFVHYNTEDEVDRLLAGVTELL